MYEHCSIENVSIKTPGYSNYLTEFLDNGNKFYYLIYSIFFKYDMSNIYIWIIAELLERFKITMVAGKIIIKIDFFIFFN